MRDRGGKLPFSYLLMGILFFTIIVIVLAGIYVNYENSGNNLQENADRLRVMTESYIDRSFELIDAGLKLYDTAYNNEMQKAFPVVMAEYNRTGGDPSHMDLEALKADIGGLDIYVINDRCIIEYSTVPADVGLDFAVIYPDFCTYLHGIRNTSGFYPDRVVRDWTTGTLTKYSYMPTPDNRYILELGLHAEQFSGERQQIRYRDIIDEVREFNPYLEEVILFQKQKRVIGNSSYKPTVEDRAMLDYILWENRTSQEINRPDLGRTIFWEVIDLRDPDYAADMSIFAKLTYNDDLLATEMNRLRLLHALAGLLLLSSGALIAIVVSRKISRPIEQLMEDVDAIAGGDLDHPVHPVPGYEFSTLAESIRIMVERLKDHIRQCEAGEARFIDLVQLLPLGVFETDPFGRVTFANTTAFDVFGYTPRDLERGISITDVLVPGDRLRAKAMFRAICQGEKSQGTEYTGLKRDGSTIPLMVYTSAIIQDGVPAGIRGTIIDISRMKQIEDEIRHLNTDLERRVADRTAALEEATQEMEAFTYSVSHDLRAPLRAIDGFSYILAKTAGSRLDEKEQHYLAALRKNAGQMDSLITGLLTLSRIGRQELNRERVDPGPLVREVIAELREQFPERTIDVAIGDLPHCSADPVMLRQVYRNLIGNAAKFTRDTPEPRIVIGAIAKDAGTTYFVRDNGVGFDMRYAGRLFEPFQQLHTTEGYEGEGIGLAIVARIIRRHGGSIWAKGEPGKGATFSFTFDGDSRPA
ncbi:MAG TPA: PAS domain S-box protein [Methanoregulaceae archaeon]|nr:PAS domain S-box protein [Methanoregulaceae archaeon]